MISVLLFGILFLFMLSYQFYCQADNTYYQHDTQKNHRRSHIYFLFLYNANPLPTSLSSSYKSTLKIQLNKYMCEV